MSIDLRSGRKALAWMKKNIYLYPIILLSLIIGLGFKFDAVKGMRRNAFTPMLRNSESEATGIPTLNGVWSMIGQVKQERVLNHLRKLTGVEQVCLDQGCYTITNRFTGSQGLQWTKDYVYEQLVSLRYSVEIQDWSKDGYSDQNLIVRKLGVISPQEEIYFVAHMDGANGSPAADDNASGVASLLELARILSNRLFDKTVVLLFSTGEEQDTLGVQSYLDQLTPDELDAIKFAIDVDMLGYDTNQDGAMELFNGSQPVDFVQLLGNIIDAYQISLSSQIVSGCG